MQRVGRGYWLGAEVERTQSARGGEAGGRLSEGEAGADTHRSFLQAGWSAEGLAPRPCLRPLRPLACQAPPQLPSLPQEHHQPLLACERKREGIKR